MKYELLKRTAIALFVGSVISTYSVAEGGKISAESKFKDIANAINQNDANITKIKQNVSALAKSLKGDDQNPGLLDALEEANKGLNENKEALALKADQSAVDDINAELDVRAKALETLQKEKASVKDLTDISENVKAGFDSIQDKVHNLQEALAGDGTEEKPGLINSVNSAVEELNDNIAKKADKATVEQNTKEIEKIKNLEGYKSLVEVKAMVDDVKEYVDVVDSDVDELVEEHNSLAEKHNKLAEGVKKFTEEYNVFTNATNEELNKKADADDVEDALSRKANASDVYTKTESDSKLNAKANVADVYSKTETDNKFALKADNSVVSTQAVDINNLRTDVNAHTKRLDHLDNRVNKLDKDLKRGLAAQAALTGLFQPYTVGKVNFTAAVGGYKSQTAVAVGTGYRYNQNIATKAGVAFTQGGGVTYNAGVNFEW